MEKRTNKENPKKHYDPDDLATLRDISLPPTLRKFLQNAWSIVFCQKSLEQQFNFGIEPT